MLITIGDKTKKCMNILGIESYPFTEKELKTKYRKLALKYHPDHGGDQKKFIEIDNAYKHICNLAISGNEPSEQLEKPDIQKDPLSVYELCTECNGVGLKKYPKFQGRRSCSKCNGNGDIDIEIKCRALGCDKGIFTLRSGRKVDCRVCFGTGIFGINQKTCDECFGMGTVPHYIDVTGTCRVCHGLGEVKLYLENPVLTPGAVGK